MANIGNTFYDAKGYIVGNDGNFYRLAHIDNNAFVKTTGGIGGYNNSNGSGQFTVATTYKIYLSIPSSHKKSNTLLHCDIIGDPANYYRGQTYIDSGTVTTAIGDVVWAKTATGGGTAGNFYEAKTVQSSIDLAAEDYSSTTNWTDLGSDWDGAGSWRTGVSGTPLMFGENGEDYLPPVSGTQIYKLSKKSTSIKLLLWSGDNGVTWSNRTNNSAYNVFNTTTNTSEPTSGSVIGSHLFMVFYETHTDMTENADNSEVIDFGFVQLLTSTGFTKLSSSLINKVAFSQGTSEWDRRYPLFNTEIHVANKKLHTNDDYKHEVLSPWPNIKTRAVKVLPYLTKSNNKAFINLVYKEIKRDGGWGDDEKFRVENNVSTTTDDNGNTVLIGQKRIELPYFIEDKE